MSLTVIRPMQRRSASTTRSFSIRCWWSRRFASSGVTLSVAVTRSLVISSATGRFGSLAKRTSRLVMMPTSRPSPGWTTGTPEMLWSAIKRSTSASLDSGPMVSGSTTMPDSNFLTRLTSLAWRSIDRFLWMTPRPPAWAMAIAMALSVTVSMAEAMIGMFSRISRVTRVSVLADVGRTAERAGRSSTSSKVRASGIASSASLAMSSLRTGATGALKRTGLPPVLQSVTESADRPPP